MMKSLSLTYFLNLAVLTSSLICADVRFDPSILCEKGSKTLSKKKQKKHSKKNGKKVDKPQSAESIARVKIQTPISVVPSLLSKIPEVEGLVLDVKTIRIEGVDNPHNASLVKDPSGGYLLAFRYDSIATSGRQWLFTQIGIAKLDANFNQIDNFYPIETNSRYSEDPRLFECMGSIYLFYNDLESEDPYLRTMHMGKLNTVDMTLEYIENLDVKICNTEKNWIPFYSNYSQTQFLLSYWYNPHRVLRVYSPGQSYKKLMFEPESDFLSLDWEKTWGQIRGGTPALLVDGEYLAFFHSSVKDPSNQRLYYLMGAYTFSQYPPYTLTRISKCPIVFDDIFMTPVCRTADQSKRVIFPAGYVISDSDDGGTVIHVSCGENDSGTKIISLDKKKLYKSLNKIGS